MGIASLARQEFEAAEASLQRLDWTCPRCGHHALAEVLGSAHVVTQAHALANGVEARDGAKASAAEAADADVRRCLELAKCPSCRTRDARAPWFHGAKVALPLPLALGVFALLGFLVPASEGDVGIALTIGGAFGGLAVGAWALATLISRSRLLARADLAVDFVLDA